MSVGRKRKEFSCYLREHTEHMLDFRCLTVYDVWTTSLTDCDSIVYVSIATNIGEKLEEVEKLLSLTFHDWKMLSL